ncbi:MAG: TetR family transcriptional regulator [Gammaproteobacteria bacterium]|nr:TetR family transcriptional regulator [Gammaproteobacteria bacterium]
MVRKTKAETEQTRLEIIAAARRVFAGRGVSRTTLADIAKEAGVSRGAIYWHFKNKPDLFFAMMEQVSLPLVDLIEENLPAQNPGDPLRSIRASMVEILRLLKDDDIARTTFEIVNSKCEYVDEFSRLDTRVTKTGCAYIQKLTRAYEDAQQKGLLRTGADPAQYALDSYLFMKGLINLWLADADGSIIRDKAAALIDSHIAMRYKSS